MEERPEEIRDFEETIREVDRYIAKMEEHDWQEEELFSRIPFMKWERNREKYLKNQEVGIGGVWNVCLIFLQS
ncbi:neuroguidin isoform X3 [Spatholobus suberectus]|nr:neuroguidin isoform X3 [Spatholobus suberectus]